MDQKLLWINWFPCIISINLYEDNQATIKTFLAYIINPQAIPPEVLITAIHELYLRNKFGMLDTRSKMQLDDLNSKTHAGKSLMDIIDRTIGVSLNEK